MDIFANQEQLRSFVSKKMDGTANTLSAMAKRAGISKATFSRKISESKDFNPQQLFDLLLSWKYSRKGIKEVFKKLHPEALKESKYQILLSENEDDFLSTDYEKYVSDSRYFDILNMAQHSPSNGNQYHEGFSKDEYISKHGTLGLEKIDLLKDKRLIEEKNGRIVTPENKDYQVRIECVKSSIKNLVDYHDVTQMGKNKQIATLQDMSTSPRGRENVCKTHTIIRKLVKDIVKTGEFGEAHFQELLNLRERLKEQNLSGTKEEEQKTERISLGIILADFEKPSTISKGTELKQ